MIERAYVQRMARYNRWQNENLFGVADRLSEEERRRERGAFFGSIHKTLSHILWGDQMWMSRLAGTRKPDVGIPGSVDLFPVWEGLKAGRASFDRTMLDWADGVEPSWLEAEQSYYSLAARARHRPAALGACDAYVQSSDPSSRPGPLHADAGRRQAARYRPAGDARMSAAKVD